jgi:hypothetical protein
MWPFTVNLVPLNVCKEIGRGVQKLTGDNLKLVLDEFSTLS